MNETPSEFSPQNTTVAPDKPSLLGRIGKVIGINSGPQIDEVALQEQIRIEQALEGPSPSLRPQAVPEDTSVQRLVDAAGNNSNG